MRLHNRRQAACNEGIAAPKFRNHMCDKLFIFKGIPSTSPLCTWVNEPREPEALPADWVYDESSVGARPDNPPF
ncbi:hypothetical protein MSG_01615 [Mycobacterium shigaense]|uniref:Uncharacterized protein n=1 Tax=Mycobacterium shigaense TaxID=722731 RepID=A0A1Z4EFP9_9MYCO|nr:hypothetical protein B2J96_06910 [Mycobacterium shigaense]BAX91769.1 hypothetical protein MSG_01615 [Mycobacterium shigaense]